VTDFAAAVVIKSGDMMKTISNMIKPERECISWSNLYAMWIVFRLPKLIDFGIFKSVLATSDLLL
jgi:hypothetical protein